MYHKPGAIIIEGHVQGLANTRALGEVGVPVFVIDKTNCIARYSKYCSKFFYCPDFHSTEFIDFIIKLAIKEKLDGWVLIPSNDHAVYTISTHKTRIEKYYKTTIPAIEIVDKIYNKANLLKIARQQKIPIPKTWYFTNLKLINQQLSWPVLTKGKMGLNFYKSLKRKAFLSHNKAELQQQLMQIKKVFPLDNTFTQELIPFDGTNKTISFTAFCSNGEIKTFWMGEKLREHPIQFGTATFTKSVFEQDCLIHSQKLLKALNYTGVCEVEYLKDPRDGEYKLIEINARTWLWVGHAIACGVNFPLYIYNFLNNISNNYPASYTKGTKWINYLTDTFIVLKLLKSSSINLRQLVESYRGEKIKAIFNKKDLKPALAFFILALYLARKREIG